MIVCSRCKASKEQLPQQPMGASRGEAMKDFLNLTGV